MEHFAVCVYRNGDLIVTIESNSLCGRELLPGDEDTIRTAARCLLSFIGAARDDDEVSSRQVTITRQASGAVL